MHRLPHYGIKFVQGVEYINVRLYLMNIDEGKIFSFMLT